MKALFTILSVLLLAAPSRAADAADEAVSAIGLLPSQRLGQHVTPQERNPFAAPTKEINKVTQTEETKRRRATSEPSSNPSKSPECAATVTVG